MSWRLQGWDEAVCEADFHIIQWLSRHLKCIQKGILQLNFTSGSRGKNTDYFFQFWLWFGAFFYPQHDSPRTETRLANHSGPHWTNYTGWNLVVMLPEGWILMTWSCPYFSSSASLFSLSAVTSGQTDQWRSVPDPDQLPSSSYAQDYSWQSKVSTKGPIQNYSWCVKFTYQICIHS